MDKARKLKRKLTRLKSKLKKWIAKNGMFSRFLVVFCIAYIVRIIEWSMRTFEATQVEPASIVTAGVGFFGGELFFLCLKRVFAKGRTGSPGPADMQEGEAGDKYE